MRHRLIIGSVLALLAGCSTVNLPQQPATSKPVQLPDGSSIDKPASATTGRLKPMPLRTFTVSTECKFKDESGNFGSAKVDVLNSKVRALNVVLTMPKRGVCRYDLDQFQQTQALPSVELTGNKNCRIRMWEQGEQITVSFADCHTLCSPNSAHDYVWPLLIDKPTGKCD
jgi:hypothetical protein